MTAYLPAILFALAGLFAAIGGNAATAGMFVSLACLYSVLASTGALG